MGTPQNIQRYHVTIKDLVSGETMGFMLNPGKDGSSMFKYNTLAPIVAKNQSGEITMGDLTNTSVFVQFSWSGQTSATGQPFGPRGIKYRTPRYLYSAMLPTQMYRYGQGVDTTTQDGEIRIAKAVTAGTLLPNGERISCYAIDNNTANDTMVYAGSEDSASIFQSDDKGDTRTLLVDIDTELGTSHGKIRQLLLVKDKRTKKLCVLCGQVGTGQSVHLYTYSLSDNYGFDLLKHESGLFYDPDTQEENRYPVTPDHIHLATIPSATITYTSITDTLTIKSPIKITNIASTPTTSMLQVTGMTDADINMLRNVNSIGIKKEGSVTPASCQIYFLNDTNTPLQYAIDDKTALSVPGKGMIISYTTIDWTKRYSLCLNNKIAVSDVTKCRPGMVIDGTTYRIYKIDSSDIYVDGHIPTAVLARGGGTFIFDTDSYQTVFDVTGLTNVNKSILGVKYKKGSTVFSIIDEFRAGKNERTLMYKDNHMYTIPEKFTTNPTVIVADRNIGATSDTAYLNHIQSCGVSSALTGDLHNIIQVMKLGYDETISDPEEYIGAILYYPTDKYQYQFMSLQLLALKDQRLRMYSSNGTTRRRTYQDYYSNNNITWTNDLSYGCEKKHTTQGFDEDIPTTMASQYDAGQGSIPISIGYDEIGFTSYFSTFKRIGGDTITIWKAMKTGVEKEIDIPGPGYATGVQFANNKVFFCSKNFGRIYTYITNKSYGNVVTQTKYEVINMQKYDTSGGATNQFTELETSNLLTGVIYEGSYVFVSDIDGTIYSYDAINELYPMTEKANIEEIAIDQTGVSVNAILPLGDRLLIQTDIDTIWNLDKSNDIKDKAYLVSSSYGAYLGTVRKNRIQAKVIVNNQVLVGDKGQKFRFAVSFDNGNTFNYLGKVLGSPFLPDDFYNQNLLADYTDYEYLYDDLIGDDKNEMRFRYPYEALSKRICYKIEIYPGGCTDADEIVIGHIENQYLLQSFKEILLQLDVYLRPKIKLLDGSYEHEPDAHRKKLDFLQTLWDEQRKCEIKMPWGAVYYGVPFAVPGTGNDGFAVSSIDIEPGKKDMDRATYSVQMSFKTIIKL